MGVLLEAEPEPCEERTEEEGESSAMVAGCAMGIGVLGVGVGGRAGVWVTCSGRVAAEDCRVEARQDVEGAPYLGVRLGVLV